MSNAFGMNQIASVGSGQRTLAAPETARMKAGGITIDWSTVSAVSGSDVTLDDGDIILIGDKYIRYGTVVTRITNTGLFGPADTGASDGRQLVTNAVRGDSFILDQTVKLSDLSHDVVGGAFDAGLVFRDHLNLGYSGAPTEANIETMFPSVSFVKDMA